MKKTILIVTALMAGMTWGKTVGLWKDHRSYIRDGMLKTMQDAGWETVILEKKDLSTGEKFKDLDVIFLPGGHNAYQFADFNGRRNMVRFVAGGKGILAGACRGGYVRNANRPLFPQVGEVYNRVNGPYVFAYGDSELAKAIDQPFCPGGWDHMVAKVGQRGEVFAVSGDDVVGVYGEVYGGRYLIFGAFIGIGAKTEPMQGTERTALLAMLNWLNSGPKLNEKEKAKNEAQADLDFLRRELIWDWTINGRGPDREPGVIPAVRNRLAVPLESRLYTLQYMNRFLPEKQGKKCDAQIKTLERAVKRLDDNYRKEVDRKTKQIERMDKKQLLSENPVVHGTNLISKIEAAPGKTEEEKKVMIHFLQRCSAGSTPNLICKRFAAFVHGEEIEKKLFPEPELKKLTSGADKAIAGFRPAVKAAKAEIARKERKQDLAAVPGLMKDCVSKDVQVRREAVVELGRIGDSRSTDALVKLLKDPDEKVRIDAIIALGWMQSKNAVPELIKIAQEKDLFMKRRAIQALGQIGDSRAVDVLMSNIDDPDSDVSQNAILALGWLKAKKAVAPLLKMVTDCDPKEVKNSRKLMCAILALGYIGDKSALPALEKLESETKDYPMTKRGKKILNILSGFFPSPRTLGLQGCSQLAIEEIKAGGLKEPGIRQNDDLALKEHFYALTGSFNALAGRSKIIQGSNFADNPAALWPYVREAGFTGVHQAWGGDSQMTPEDYLALVRAAGDLGLTWIDTLPGNRVGIEKAGANVVLLGFQDVPALCGFWNEETYPETSISGPEFEEWLKEKYGPDFRKQLGVDKKFDFSSRAWNGWNDKGGVGNSTNVYSGPLKAEMLHCFRDKLLASWRESQEWLQGMRKGCAFTFSISTAQPVKYPGLTANAGKVIDVNGPENYQCFGRFNSFFMEMHKDGEARPVMSEFYNWYCPSPEHAERGFAQHLMHGECFYNFDLSQIFEQASRYNMWSWNPERWDRARKVFQKARDIKEYIAVPESAANVGLLVSDTSGLLFDPVNMYVGGLGLRWIHNNSAMWTAMNQCHVPTDVIWLETMTPEKLARYRVLVLSDVKVVTQKEADMFRDWVKSGGVLIATGTTSLFDQWGVQRKNYLLSDVFGVDYLDNIGVSDPDDIDTYQWRHRGPACEKVKSGLEGDNFRSFVHRDVKPVKSLGTYTVSDKTEDYLPGIAPKTVCEYDMPLGYDKVKPTSATALAKFNNGDPALTVNSLGKGLCYLWTPDYPALCHVSSDWEMEANRLDFWPNVRELLGAMIEGGLEQQGATLPVEVSNVSKEVEVTVRQQPEHNRWMVHLLNYDPDVDLVEKPSLTVHPPEGRTVKKIFYPDTDTEVEFTTGDEGIKAQMRDFGVHDMVVVEYE